MSNIENLSTAFKHINLYEILEPQKVHNVEVGTLVDISDDTNKPNEELIGSFIDKVTKPKFDILDVYENIYVTPQHLEPQKKNDLDVDIFIREDSSNDEVDSAGNVACANIQADQNKIKDVKYHNNTTSDQIFPKLHGFGEKSIYKDFIDDIFKPKAKLDENDIKKIAPVNEFKYSAIKCGEVHCQNSIFSSEKNKDFLFTPSNTRISDGLLTNELFHPKIKSNNEPFDLSIASDVPICKKLQQMPKKEDFTLSHNSEVRSIQFHTLTGHKEFNNDSNNYLPELSNALFGEESIKPKINLNVEKSANVAKSVKTEDANIAFFRKLQDFQNPLHGVNTETEKGKGNKKNETISLKTVQTKQNSVENTNFLLKLYLYNIKCSLMDENKIVKCLMHPPIPMIQTARLDKKLFGKRVVKSESELSKYTKGPDLYEKSLILPQIMARLMARNRNDEVKRNVRRKFILDCQNTGESDQNFEMPELVTEIIVKDRNKERLKALQVRKSFDEFVKFGKI